jgi:hypothetical protein
MHHFTHIVNIGKRGITPFFNICFHCSITLAIINQITMAITAYCVKCKEKRDMVDPVEVDMKGGRKAMQGKCPVCGTKMFRIMGKPKTDAPQTPATPAA